MADVALERTRKPDIALKEVDDNTMPHGAPHVESELSIEEASKQSKNRRPSRYISRKTKKIVWSRANSQCCYIDQETKKRCDSKYALEIDHAIPFCIGGSSNVENLRLLCRSHNQYLAHQVF